MPGFNDGKNGDAPGTSKQEGRKQIHRRSNSQAADQQKDSDKGDEDIVELPDNEEKDSDKDDEKDDGDKKDDQGKKDDIVAKNEPTEPV